MAGWDLFQEMDMLRRELDQVFRGTSRNELSPSFLPGIGIGGYPRVNLSEDENNYYLEALVPGITPENLDLNLLQGTLTLSGERTEPDNSGKTWHRHERGAGKFMRTVELPDAVEADKIDAEYRDGVLLITLPKRQEALPKKISVKAH